MLNNEFDRDIEKQRGCRASPVICRRFFVDEVKADMVNLLQY